MLQNPSYEAIQKSCILLYCTIPLLSSTYKQLYSVMNRFHYAGMDVETAVSGRFLESYCRQYLPSISKKDYSSSHLIVSLLKINILLIEHVYSRLQPFHIYLMRFAKDLFDQASEELRVWSYYYMCNHFKAGKQSDRNTVLLFLDSLQFVKSLYQNTALKGTSMLKESS